jgi:hypothetical protein
MVVILPNLRGTVMSLTFSKRNRLHKTELLAQAREKHSVLCVAIDTFNSMIRAGHATVAEASGAYASAVNELHHFARSMAIEQTLLFERSAERSNCERCQEAWHWISTYRTFTPEVPDLAMPQTVEYPDDDLLTEFEELSDFS